MSDMNELYSLVKKERTFNKFKFGTVSYKPIITPKNVRDGFVTRYFAKYIPASSPQISETDETTAKILKNNPLYQIISLRWKIVGKLNDYVIDKDCCNNKLLTVIEQTGNVLTLTPAEFGQRKSKIGDKVISNGYSIAFGVETENRKSVEFGDLTMPGLIRYIRNYTEYWQGE